MSAVTDISAFLNRQGRRAAQAVSKPDLLAAKLSPPLLSFAARHGFARLAAWLIGIQMSVVKSGLPKAQGGIRALYLSKIGLSEDVMASVGEDPRYTLLSLDRTAPKAVAFGFLPRTMGDNDYQTTDTEINAAKLRLRTFWHAVWKHLKKQTAIDVILTGNFSYFAEQEMAAAAEAHGIRFIAMHKECLKNPGQEKFYRRVYATRKIPFQGSLVLTYNRIERDIQIDSGRTPGDRMAICGMPRLDFIHNWRQAHAGDDQDADGKPTVTFMSFNPVTGTPFIGSKGERTFEVLDDDLENIRWTNLVHNSHLAMVRLAEQNPDIHVIIKTKNGARNLKALKPVFGDNFSGPDNFEIIVGGDPFRMIIESDVVCAFNSTTIFESLAANVPVVIPYFDEAADTATKPYVIDLGEATDRANSVEEFIDKTAARARQRTSKGRNTDLGPEQLQMLDHWLGNPDGNASKRVADTVYDHVKAHQGKPLSFVTEPAATSPVETPSIPQAARAADR